MTESRGEAAPPDKRGARLNQDDYRCQLCDSRDEDHGGTAELQVHHRVPVDEGGDHSLENLITLCAECHNWYHAFSSLTDVGLEFDEVSYELSTTDLPLLMTLGEMAPASVGELAAALNAEHSVVSQRLYKLTSIGVVAPTDTVVGSGSDGKWDFAAHVDDPAVGTLPDDPQAVARLTRDEAMRQLHETGTTQTEIAEEFGVARRTVIRGITRARALEPPIPAIPKKANDAPATPELPPQAED